MELKEIEHLAERQMTALGKNIYDIGLISQDGKVMSDIRQESEFSYAISRAHNFNMPERENVYIRAVRTHKHDILILDDVRSAGIDYLRKHYPPACIVETSIDDEGSRYQVWVRLSSSHDAATRKNCEKVIINDLESIGLYADRGANDGQHYGRLAGFHNYGFPDKPRNHCVFLIEDSGTILSSYVTETLLEKALNLPQPQRGERVPWESLEEIQDHEYEQSKIIAYVRDILAPKATDPDRSRADSFICARCSYNAFSERDTRKALLEYGPNNAYRKGSPRAVAQYLCRTVENAMKVNPPKIQQSQNNRRECAVSAVSSACPGADAPESASVSTTQDEKLIVNPAYLKFVEKGEKVQGTITKDCKIILGEAPPKFITSPFPQITENQQQFQANTRTNTATKKPVFSRPKIGVRPRPKTPTSPPHSPTPR